MPSLYQDKVVVITDVDTDAGLQCALSLAMQGARVVGLGRDQRRLARLGEQLTLTLGLDTAHAPQREICVAAIRDRFGAAQVVVETGAPWPRTSLAALLAPAQSEE